MNAIGGDIMERRSKKLREQQQTRSVKTMEEEHDSLEEISEEQMAENMEEGASED